MKRATIIFLLKCSPLLLLLYPIYSAFTLLAFERRLSSVTIGFEDFPPEYAEALRIARDKVPEYTWPALGPVVEAGEQETVPPIIHFIWFRDLYHDHLDISSIPTAMSHAPAACRNFNPDFDIRVWNETDAHDLLQEHYSWFLDVYDNYTHPIQRVDAFKYFVLWHYGGIYMDLDIACRRALNPLLPFASWYPRTKIAGANNDLMATRARHPLTAEMIRKLDERNKDWLFPYVTIYLSTGPQFTSDVVRDYLASRPPGRWQHGPDAVRVLPGEFYSEEYTFFGHSPGGTWHGKDVAVVVWVVNHLSVFYLIPAILFAFMAYDQRVLRLARILALDLVARYRRRRGGYDQVEFNDL